MILTVEELSLYSSLTSTSATIAATLIPVIQERITILTNNSFLTDLDLQDCYTFNATARTIVSASNYFTSYGFAAGDDVHVYNSYRNDGYYTVSSVTTGTLTLTSSASVVDELSGRSIIISVVKWPAAIKQIAARMVVYDYQVRPEKSENVKSRSLGPFSETFSDGEDIFGYPKSITSQLASYTMARVT